MKLIFRNNERGLGSLMLLKGQTVTFFYYKIENDKECNKV